MEASPSLTFSPPRRRLRQRGTTMIATAAFVAVLSSAVGVAFLATTNIGRNTTRTKSLQSAIAVGDAYLETAFAQWRDTCRRFRSQALRADAFTLTPPAAALLPQPAGYVITGFSIDSTDVEGAILAKALPPPAAQGQDPGTKSFFYKVSVNVRVPALSGKPVDAKVRRIFEKRQESPWRYAIFYNEMLEIHPSPNFTVNGWVHTNGSLFAAPDGGKALNFGDRVTYSDAYIQGYAAGNWAWRTDPLTGLKRTESPTHPGLSDGAAPAYAAGLPPTNEGRKDPFGMTPTQFDPSDASQDNDGYRELIERPVNSATDPLTDDAMSNPRFYNNAGVKILVDATNTVTVMKANGAVVSATSALAADRAFYNAVAPAITTNQNIQDFREASSVRLVSFDVSKLTPAALADMPGWNGVVYISDTSAGTAPAAGPKRGVRLNNGATLPDGGLTVASDNPVYIQGDYNTLGTRQSSAVIGDAVMFLSNNWNDANSSADIGSPLRKATTTTINTAILAGNVPTDPSYTDNRAYSGGVENFPRFMENWGGVTINYNGSMVQLFKSQQAVGRWGSSGQSYSAPIRNWAFDPLFRTNPPPGTLVTTYYNKQRWFLEYN